MFKKPEQRTRRWEAREAALFLFGLCFGCGGAGGGAAFFVFE